MSEKFNPLSEAQQNASEDRRRFYDWVGNTSEHDDNEGFRAANQDMASYLESRSYEDDAGNLRDSQDRVIANPNNESDEEHHDRLYEAGLSDTDTRFIDKESGKPLGLKALAEMVAEAKQAGDKTLEIEAREVFDNKFIETAEKLGWEGVVETDNGNGTTTIEDRNEIAEKRLAYYESIMNGSEGSKDSDNKSSKDEEYVGRHRGEAEDANQTDEEYTGKHRADEEYVGRHRGEAGQESDESGEDSEEYVGRHRGEEGEDQSNEDLNARFLDWMDERDPGEEAALAAAKKAEGDNETEKDAESEEADPDKDLDWMDERDPGEEAALAEAESEPESWREKMRNAYAKAGAFVSPGVRKWLERYQDDKNSNKRKYVLGAMGTVAALGAAYYALRHGMDTTSAVPSVADVGSVPSAPGGAEFVNDALVVPTPGGSGGGEKSSVISEIAQIVEGFSDKATTVTAGEGGWQTLAEAGVPASQHAAIWEEIGNRLADTDLVYRMSDGNWGWSRSGNLDSNTLNTIASVINKYR